MTRTGFLVSHPIQYYAPIFRELAKRCDLTVFFAHRQTAEQQARAGFDVAFDWDVDLLSGYDSRFLTNVARQPSTRSCASSQSLGPEMCQTVRWPRSSRWLVAARAPANWSTPTSGTEASGPASAATIGTSAGRCVSACAADSCGVAATAWGAGGGGGEPT